ncbi:ribonuclease domain-containing protein [Streptomyces sp. NPDC058295]|uniref:ribonuclease domain-containing protein n=1 Tax=Streptomyces sp. NPDC058295 TaxID=3346431 RepID=UPI0036E35A32
MLLRFVPRVLVRLLLPLALLTGCTTGEPGPQDSTAAVATAAEPSWAGGLATVRESELPADARRTLRLIDDGGPFPYAKDGAVFGNFEGLLPAHKRGYYHEYTVETPGSRDRGARRVVTGQGDEIYYTDDHYDTFRAVLR